MDVLAKVFSVVLFKRYSSFKKKQKLTLKALILFAQVLDSFMILDSGLYNIPGVKGTESRPWNININAMA